MATEKNKKSIVLYFIWKNPYFKLFPTKSTTLNPMVKSDLVTSWGETIGFFSVANTVQFKIIFILDLDLRYIPIDSLA